MRFVDPTEPYRKFGSGLFLKKSRTSPDLTMQSRSENALGPAHGQKELFNFPPAGNPAKTGDRRIMGS